MNLQELHKHSKAVKEANQKGISLFWGNELHLDQDLFLSMVTNYELQTTKQPAKIGYQLGFSLNGMFYYTVVSEKEYEESFVIIKDKKMTS